MSDRLQDVAAGRSGPKARGFGAWIGGRARRREYWTWVVPWFVVVTLATMAAPALTLLLSLPLLLIWIRRLHDLGWTGWMAPVINIAVGIIGWIEMGVMSAGGRTGGLLQSLAAIGAIIALGVIPGEARTNEYGPPPGRKTTDMAETFV
ncbi:MAG: DUF805 domain-containing protein [Pseudomonadota bacterium]